MQKAAITEESFIRDLPYSVHGVLASKLDYDHLWERLASVIPTKPDNIFNVSDKNFEPKYCMADMAVLNASASSTKALLKNWGIQNCRVKHLVKAVSSTSRCSSSVHTTGYSTHGTQGYTQFQF
uniref:Uncharacterized protein n=1 Tax=Arion vulgaris TaxID=1028688 RepID=A0A0B7AD67_9EUPU